MVTKQNLTGLLAQTGRINNSNKFAAEGLTTIVNDIANLFYFSPVVIKDDIVIGNITKDTYVSLAVGPGVIKIDTAENFLIQNGIII